MTDPKRLALVAWALVACAWAAPGVGSACALVLTEHRSGLALTRLPLNPAQPAADVAFTHSVLGTPVLDRYVWRHSAQGWRAHLVEERFEGEGYGLPSAAGPGERLLRQHDEEISERFTQVFSRRVDVHLEHLPNKVERTATGIAVLS